MQLVRFIRTTALKIRRFLRRVAWFPFDTNEDLLRQSVHWRGGRLFQSDPINTGDSQVDAQFAVRNRDSIWEYVLDLQEPCIIEPKYGFAITRRPLRLIRHALNPKCRKFKEARPRVRQLFSALIPRQVDAPALISLRDFNETNYWHFFNDVLSKLLLLKELDLFPDVPVLISRQLAERPFFEYFRSSCPLLQREIIVQDRSSINVGRLIIVQTQVCHPRIFDYLAKLIPASVESDERRIF